jgi:hypothetical protein
VNREAISVFLGRLVMSDICHHCHRGITERVTYACTVPGCVGRRFCCPACILEHMRDHVRERDDRIVLLLDRIDGLIEQLRALRW